MSIRVVILILIVVVGAATPSGTAGPPLVQIVPRALSTDVVSVTRLIEALDLDGVDDLDDWLAASAAHEAYLDAFFAILAANESFSRDWPVSYWNSFPPIKPPEARRARRSFERAIIEAEARLLAQLRSNLPARRSAIDRFEFALRRARLQSHQATGISGVQFLDPIRFLDGVLPGYRNADDDAAHFDAAERTLDQLLQRVEFTRGDAIDAFVRRVDAAGLDLAPHRHDDFDPDHRAAISDLWHAASTTQAQRAEQVIRHALRIVDDAAQRNGAEGRAAQRRYLESIVVASTPHGVRPVESTMRRATWLIELPESVDAAIDAEIDAYHARDLRHLTRQVDACLRESGAPWPYSAHDPAAPRFDHDHPVHEARVRDAAAFIAAIEALIPASHRDAYEEGNTTHPLIAMPTTPRRAAHHPLVTWMYTVAPPLPHVVRRDRLPWPAVPCLVDDDWRAIAAALGRPENDPDLMALRATYTRARNEITEAWDAAPKVPGWMDNDSMMSEDDLLDVRAARRAMHAESVALHARTADLIEALAAAPSLTLTSFLHTFRLWPDARTQIESVFPWLDTTAFVDPIEVIGAAGLTPGEHDALLALVGDELEALRDARRRVTAMIVERWAEYWLLDARYRRTGDAAHDRQDQILDEIIVGVDAASSELRAATEALLHRADDVLDDAARVHLRTAVRHAALGQASHGLPDVAGALDTLRSSIAPPHRATFDAARLHADRAALRDMTTYFKVRAAAIGAMPRDIDQIIRLRALQWPLRARLDQHAERLLATAWLLRESR